MQRIQTFLAVLLVVAFGVTIAVANPVQDGNPQVNKERIELLVNEVYNNQNIALINFIYAPDYQGTLSFSNPSGFRSRDDYIILMQQYYQAFSDFEAELELLVAEGEWVTSRIILSGTFDRGNYYGIDPNGRDVAIALHTFHRFNDSGQIVEEIIEWDNLAFSIDLGIIPDEVAEAAG